MSAGGMFPTYKASQHTPKEEVTEDEVFLDMNEIGKLLSSIVRYAYKAAHDVKSFREDANKLHTGIEVGVSYFGILLK